MKRKKIIEKMVSTQLRKGDLARILIGKDKGKDGKVLFVNYKSHKITIEGLNISKKAVRPSQQNQKGGIVEVSLPIHVSNIRLICPKCNTPTSIFRKEVNKKRVRICKNCKEIVDKV